MAEAPAGPIKYRAFSLLASHDPQSVAACDWPVDKRGCVSGYFQLVRIRL